MGNTQQIELRNKQRSTRFSRGFQPATVALLVAIGVSGCANTDKQIKPYSPPAAQAVAPAATAVAPAGAVVTEYRTDSPAIQVRADRPTEYEVVKGDTLWDISAEFLHDPFQWPNVWKQNPQIKNPHLIYPGDLIRLSVVDGRAVIDVLRPDGAGGYSSVAGGTASAGKKRMRNGREVLSPAVHEEELIQSVSSEAAEAIRNFTRSPHVMATDELQDAAYVLSATDERLASANGDEIYARGFKGPQVENYNIFRPSEPLVDPETGAILGYEAKRVADAKLTRGGDPATLRLFNSAQETLVGDRLVPKHQNRIDTIVPKAVDPSMSAKVISLYDSLARAAQHQVVVINKGINQGMLAGSVLEIASGTSAVFDKQANNGEGEFVELPERIKGNAIIFRSFQNVSYALILQATLPVQAGDTMRGF